MNTKRFTILHNNDMHGNFLAETGQVNNELIGGLSLLSGYINQVRKTEKNVIYAIAGDMVQGSIIDSEYKGISTIEIMNYLSPDVATLGNHELDYGLPHLLFLEKLANFPIINSNMYISKYNKRLMSPYLIKELDGFSILFIGIITETVLDSLRRDGQIGTFISLEDAARETGRICDAYKNADIDLTVLLTHIGFDSDKELAALLKPEWGVDMILGGHSHTVLEQPAVVNDILIAQAAVGTNQIGRFDLLVDDDTNAIVDWKWQLVPITNHTAEPDLELQKFIDNFNREVDAKYSTLICRLARQLTHPRREIETALGNLVSDIFAENSDCDVAFIGSGSIRTKTFGPVVTLRDLKQTFPYDEGYLKYTVTGEQLQTIFAHIMRKENRNSEGECYQVNSGVKAIYDDVFQRLVMLQVGGQAVDRDRLYVIGLTDYHAANSEKNIGLSMEALTAHAPMRVGATSLQTVLEEYLRGHQNISRDVESRLIYQ
jgi:5'-nucleotidase